ncbi:transposable element Tcb2 transposase [Trichonephila clavipes]|nr:transposable element Tcb2 transposase [Trichonephila clavipes]
MENRKETMIEERKLVIKLSNEGKSQRNIAKVVGRSVNCIQKILQKFKKTGMLANNEGRARTKIMNSITERRVIRQVKIDPKIAASTSNTLGRSVSAETQDNDLKHTAFVVKECLFYHCRNQLNTPPQSPDLNVIENLWSHLERVVQKHQITSKEQLKSVLQEEWLNIAPETTRHLVESMPRRLEAVISAKVMYHSCSIGERPDNLAGQRNTTPYRACWVTTGYEGARYSVGKHFLNDVYKWQFES